MVENNHNPYGHVDVELSAVAKDARRKRRTRCLLYIVIFAVFQVGVIVLFALTIAKFRTPKFRVRSASFPILDYTETPTSPSFNITMNSQLEVKNTNFGHFRYRDTTVDFYYRERKVGEGSVWKARAKARDTRRFVVQVILLSTNVNNTPELASDLSNGVLRLRSRSRLSGRVKIMVVLKKNKNANMDCTMDLAISSRELRNITCR